MYNQNKSLEERVADLEKSYDARQTKFDQNIGAAAQKIRELEKDIREIKKNLSPTQAK
jgi:uncharacterized protein YukE